jgi:hypothetical protein
MIHLPFKAVNHSSARAETSRIRLSIRRSNVLNAIDAALADDRRVV